MRGMNETAFLTSLRHGAAVKGNWSPISTEDAMHAPAKETGRLLCDDGSAVPCRPAAEKTQRGCRVAAWRLAAWMRDCITGKQVVEAVRIGAVQTRPMRSGVLKSRGCDAMTGAGGSLSGRSSESWERNGLGRSDPDRCTPQGKTDRNLSDGRETTVFCTSQIDLAGCRDCRVTLDRD